MAVVKQEIYSIFPFPFPFHILNLILTLLLGEDDALTKRIEITFGNWLLRIFLQLVYADEKELQILLHLVSADVWLLRILLQLEFVVTTDGDVQPSAAFPADSSKVVPTDVDNLESADQDVRHSNLPSWKKSKKELELERLSEQVAADLEAAELANEAKRQEELRQSELMARNIQEDLDKHDSTETHPAATLGGSTPESVDTVPSESVETLPTDETEPISTDGSSHIVIDAAPELTSIPAIVESSDIPTIVDTAEIPSSPTHVADATESTTDEPSSPPRTAIYTPGRRMKHMIEITFGNWLLRIFLQLVSADDGYCRYFYTWFLRMYGVSTIFVAGQEFVVTTDGDVQPSAAFPADSSKVVPTDVDNLESADQDVRHSTESPTIQSKKELELERLSEQVAADLAAAELANEAKRQEELRQSELMAKNIQVDLDKHATQGSIPVEVSHPDSSVAGQTLPTDETEPISNDGFSHIVIDAAPELTSIPAIVESTDIPTIMDTAEIPSSPTHVADATESTTDEPSSPPRTAIYTPGRRMKHIYTDHVHGNNIFENVGVDTRVQATKTGLSGITNNEKHLNMSVEPISCTPLSNNPMRPLYLSHVNGGPCTISMLNQHRKLDFFGQTTREVRFFRRVVMIIKRNRVDVPFDPGGIGLGDKTRGRVFSKIGKEISKLVKVKAQVSEVKGVMMENIEKVLDRGEKIELLVDKTSSDCI
ncbi:Vesicle-associated membrane protein 722 [Artemisia annua]|uniref:Vesicle-associated membrane protein 722 n=1 Tax=Artemisia annua TaxID=35608 RepID=A0A2U1NLK7_ARTAN|nr:Vesicle-associated membrane protein 722 [Artemisia annua]